MVIAVSFVFLGACGGDDEDPYIWRLTIVPEAVVQNSGGGVASIEVGFGYQAPGEPINNIQANGLDCQGDTKQVYFFPLAGTSRTSVIMQVDTTCTVGPYTGQFWVCTVNGDSCSNVVPAPFMIIPSVPVI